MKVYTPVAMLDWYAEFSTNKIPELNGKILGCRSSWCIYRSFRQRGKVLEESVMNFPRIFFKSWANIGFLERVQLDRLKCKSLSQWYINTIIVFLDIISHPVFYLKPEIWTLSIDRAQPSTLHLKTETESSLRNVVGFK
jgi:hypothetical protein